MIPHIAKEFDEFERGQILCYVHTYLEAILDSTQYVIEELVDEKEMENS